MRADEVIAVLEYSRANQKLKEAKTEEEKKKLEPVVDHFKKQVDKYVKQGNFQKQR